MNENEIEQAPVAAPEGEPETKADEKLSDKKYLKELKKLHVELVKLQQWVVKEGLKVCIVFEGRDGRKWSRVATSELSLLTRRYATLIV